MVNEVDFITLVCGFALLLIAPVLWGRVRWNGKRLLPDVQAAGYHGDPANVARWMVHPMVPGLMVVLLVAGGGAAIWRGQAIDADLRNRMLHQATAIARQINVERARALSFTAEDRSNPAFQRLRHQMMAYAQATNIRSLYSMAIRNQRIVFGPESLAEDDPFASPPGTPYEKPPPKLLGVFETQLAQTMGPHVDEYGSFVTACAPVTDPQTGETLLVVGIDMEAQTWQAAIARARLGPILFTLTLAMIVLGGGILLERRRMLSVERQGRLHHTELWLTATIGLLLTLGVAYVAHDGEVRFRQTRFAQLAETQAGSVSKAMHDLRDYRLEALGRFFESSQQVERDEFQAFSDFLRKDELVQAWEWIPAVPAEAKPQLEEAAHGDGLPDFAVYQKDPRGQRESTEGRDVFYPVYYAEPLTSNEPALGYDVSSEPTRRAALEVAMQTGMTTATNPLTLVQEAGTQKGMLVLRPVFAEPRSRAHLRGFAAAVLRFDSLAERALAQFGREPDLVTLELFQLSTDHPPRPLTSPALEKTSQNTADDSSWFDNDLGVSVTAPLFAFGKAFAVRVHPGPSFLAANPLRAGWGAGLTGLLLTAVLTLLVGILTKGRTALETQVLARTAELRQSEEKYRAFFATSQDCVFITSLDGRLVDCNDATVELFGYESKEEVLSLNVAEFYLTPEDRVKHVAVIREKGFTREHPVPMKKKDGTAISTLASSIARKDSNGNVIGFQGTVRDVTDRENAEKALRESESKLNKVVNAAQDAIIILDHEGNIALWNESAVRIFGYTIEEALGQNLHRLLAPPRFQEDHQKGFAEFVHSGKGKAVGQVLELAALRKNGEEFPVELSLSSMQLKEEWHAVGILRDITERKRSQDVLIKTNRQLAQAITRANELAFQAELANMAKSEFLANMSHEIRTPMNGIIGMTGLLLDTELSEEQRQYAEVVRASGQALLSVVNDILDFSKIEARKLDLEILDFDLRTTLEDTADLLAVKAHEKGLEMVCMVDPETPLRLRGDPGRLRQILVNMTGNAIKFTQYGSVTVRAGLEREEDGYAVIRFVVSDTGIGIPSNRLNALFSPFTQVDGSTTRKYGGTGLGLSISKQLVGLMGGQIGVESEEGKGSTFWFTAAFEKQGGVAQSSQEVPTDLHDVRILIVDDHAANRLLVATLLHHWGCRFDETSEGTNALSMLRTAAADGDPYQVALIDMQMPGMDGDELGRCIKDDPQCRDTGLIMMTSLGRRGDVGRLEAAGFGTYLAKPIRQDQLHDSLVLALEGKTRGESAAANPTIARHPVCKVQTHRARILLAEDNITNQQVALALLKRLGYRADAVADGKEVLEALQTIPYDLVLMDCHMPEMDGYEATRRIRAPHSSVRNHAIPVIAVTARAMKGDREQCLHAGMNDYLRKPVDPKALAEMLDKWLPDEIETGNTKLENRNQRGEGEEGGARGRITSGSGPQASSQKGQDRPVFDKAVLLRGLMGDEELVATIVAGFLEDLPTQVEALKAYLGSGDVRSAERQAHTVKGAAANLGAEGLREVAGKMEKAGKRGDLQALSAIMPELEREFLRLQERLKLETGNLKLETGGPAA